MSHIINRSLNKN